MPPISHLILSLQSIDDHPASLQHMTSQRQDVMMSMFSLDITIWLQQTGIDDGSNISDIDHSSSAMCYCRQPVS